MQVGDWVRVLNIPGGENHSGHYYYGLHLDGPKYPIRQIRESQTPTDGRTIFWFQPVPSVHVNGGAYQDECELWTPEVGDSVQIIGEMIGYEDPVANLPSTLGQRGKVSLLSLHHADRVFIQLETGNSWWYKKTAIQPSINNGVDTPPPLKISRRIINKPVSKETT